MPVNFVFLEKEDLQSQMFEAYIDDDNAEDIEALERIEGQTIATFKTKLRQRYDVDAVFTAVGELRDQEVVKHLSAIVCYYMLRRNAARKIPSDYLKEFEIAQKWLKDVREGIEVPNLPKIEIRQELQWGSSRNEDWLI
jgi:hypothetical protein